MTPDLLPRLEKAPVIDGKMDAAEWRGALHLGKFLNANGEEATPATQAWIAIHDSTLYVAFRCEEPTPKNMRTKIIGDEKDARVWWDDSVDFYIDPGNTGRSVFRIAANSEGTIFDGEGTEDQDEPAWESGAVVRTSVGKDAWEVEMAIPMDALRHPFVQGEIIAVNAGRVRFAGGEREISSLSGRYVRPFRLFRLLQVEGEARADSVSLTSPQRGPFYLDQPAAWEFEAENHGSEPVELRIEFPGNSKQSQQIPLPPGKRAIHIPVGEQDIKGMSHCRITAGSRALYDSAYLPVRNEAPNRVAQVENPLFSELIEPAPDGLSKDGFILWSHDLDGPPPPADLALRTGAEHSRSELFRELGKEGAILINATRLDQSVDRLELAKQHGVRFLINISNREAREQGAMTASKGIVWPLDPIAVQAYKDDARRALALAKENETVWGLFAGDESWTLALRALKYFIDQGPEKYPQLKAMNEEVKTRFGFGRYGLPHSSSDVNPYRWIATYRWISAGLVDLARELRELVKNECPRLKIVSWNNQADHFPYEMGRWKEMFDVMTGQILPSLNESRDLFGFNTLFLKDISGIEEIWPCAHIEHYAANFTPEETIDLLSQTFATGATGLHLFMSDTKGRRADTGCFNTDRIGAPERWAAVTEVLARLRKEPFRVKQTPADTAIFYSNPSYQGQGDERPKSNEVEWLYNLLGPRLQGAPEFVDEYRLTRNPETIGRFKVVYIPYAPIVDDQEYEILRRYAEQGGTLVLCHDSAFRKRSDGTDRDTSALFPADGRRQFADAGRGITEYSVGKGRVLSFARNPLGSSAVVGDVGWANTFKTIQQSVGANLENPVWRFRLPHPSPHQRPQPENLCLTGNYFRWVLSEPKPMANSAVGGSYRLSRSPSREEGEIDIPFEQGKLTDRRRAILQPTDADPRESTIAWTTDQDMEITFRFNRPVEPQSVRLFYKGTLPAGRCEVLTETGEWVETAAWEQEAAAAGDVAMKHVRFAAPRSPQLRLHFKPTDSSTAFTLAEVDIWGNE